jgi:hypothetical protein
MEPAASSSPDIQRYSDDMGFPLYECDISRKMKITYLFLNYGIDF